MKAKINNIEVEGTPQEIAEFKQLMDGQNKVTSPYTYPSVPYIPYVGTPITGTYPNPLKWTEIICDGTKPSTTFTGKYELWNQ